MAHGSLSAGRDSKYLLSKVGTASGEYLGISGDGKGEREGEWIGKGAEVVGLTGVVESAAWEAFIGHRQDPTHPDFADPEKGAAVPLWGNTPRAATTRPSIDAIVAEKVAAAAQPMTAEEVAALRLAVAKQTGGQEAPLYNEFTFSAQKSFSVLKFTARLQAHQAREAGDEPAAAMWEARFQGLQDAFDAGSKAALSFIEEHAGATRAGRHPGPAARWVRAPLVAAWFPQTTSQDGDPQDHAHMPIAPRTLDAEGQVRAVDTMGVRAAHRAAAEYGNRIMVEKIAAMGWGLSLTQGPQGIEIDGVRQHEMDALSSRSKVIRPKVQKAVDAFRASQGRGPTAREMHRITQYATTSTRGKAIKESEPEFFARIVAKTNAEDLGMLDALAARFQHDQMPGPAEAFDPADVISRALFEVQTGKAVWDRFDLFEKIAEALPPHLGSTNGADIQTLYWGLVDTAIESADVRQIGGFDLAYEVPEERRHSDGTSQYLRPKSEVFVTLGHLDAEGALLRAAASAGRVRVEPDVAREWMTANAPELSESQKAALFGVLTEGAALTNLVGPAGTGKSYVLGKLAVAWPELTGGRVIGLATTERATKVLREEGIELAANVSQFLAAAQNRGEITPRRGDFVILDESSMTDTLDALAIQDYVEAGGAQWAATGDPAQLGSVNAGGWFKSSVARGAHTHTLAEVMRFDNEWEGPASLGLREGDESAVREYRRHGRLVEAGTPEQALKDAAERYVTQRLLGRVSIVTVATNADAATVAGHIRERFVELGYVTDEHGTVQLGRDDNAAGVGDVVMARRNERGLAAINGGGAVTNRDLYRLTAIRDDGSIEVLDETTGQLIVLPATYVAEDAQLGYASTAHAAEGVTVTGEAITVVTPQMGREALYVGLTRSKTSNVAIVPTVPVDAKGKVLDEEGRADVEAVIAARMQLERVEESATDVAAREFADLTDARRIHGRLEDQLQLIGEQRLEQYLDRLTEGKVITTADRDRFAGERGDPSRLTLIHHLRVAEQAGRDPEVVLREAVGVADFKGAKNVHQVTTARITRPYGGSLPAPDPIVAAQMPKDTPEHLATGWSQLWDLADERHRILGSEAAEDPPRWALDRLGKVPEDAMARLEWEDRAGRIAYAREVAGDSADDRLLSPSPGVRTPEARAVWHEGHDAAGRPSELRAESEMTAGQLRARVKAAAYIDRWAPDHVDGALEAAATAFYAAEAAQAAAIGDGDAEGEASAEILAIELRLAQAEWEAAAVARDDFIAATEATREAGRRARAEMDERGITPFDPAAQVTLARYVEQASGGGHGEGGPVGEDDVRDEEKERHLAENVAPAQGFDGEEVLTEVVQQPPARETAEFVAVELPDDLARARSVEAATAAIREAAYLRAQASAFEAEETTRLVNERAAAEAIPKRRESGEGAAERPSLAEHPG